MGPMQSVRNLYYHSEPQHLGDGDVFLSHSWHDDPQAKWEAFQIWRDAFVSEHGREPLVWFDKACIDQSQIREDLRGLPLFINGCKRVLVLCGPTYLSRLWCVLELFTFAHMGGSLDQVTVMRVLQRGKEDEDLRRIQQSVTEFDGRRCKCSVQEDKDIIVGIILAAFGDIALFNKTVKTLMEYSSAISILS